jgi:tripartite-type tricarboxylate transporter receptor subunit TctC
VPDYVVTGWYGMFVPVATPAAVVATLHAGTVKALRSKDVSERLSGEAAAIVAGTPPQFAEFLRAETAKWAGVIKKSGLRPETF